MVISVSWEWEKTNTGIVKKIKKILGLGNPSPEHENPDLGIITFDSSGNQVDLVYYGNAGSDYIYFKEKLREFKVINYHPYEELNFLVLITKELEDLKKIIVNVDNKDFEYHKTPGWIGKSGIVLGTFTDKFTSREITTYENNFTEVIQCLEKILKSKSN